jgi:hypothetical protein
MLEHSRPLTHYLEGQHRVKCIPIPQSCSADGGPRLCRWQLPAAMHQPDLALAQFGELAECLEQSFKWGVLCEIVDFLRAGARRALLSLDIGTAGLNSGAQKAGGGGGAWTWLHSKAGPTGVSSNRV